MMVDVKERELLILFPQDDKQTIYNIIIKRTYSVIKGRGQKYVKGGGAYIFIFPGGGSASAGAWKENPLKSIDFTGP